MIREAIISAVIGVVIGGGGATGAMKFWADHTYTHKDTHEHEHETMVAGFEQSLKKSSDQSQIYNLQDQIRNIKREAARQGRPLTQFEINDIEELQNKINNLKGW